MLFKWRRPHSGSSLFGSKSFETTKIREQLKPHAWNQDQITSSSALLVFVADTHISQRITQMLDLLSGGNAAAREGLKPYEGMMRGSLEGRSQESLQAWSAKQAYIALGFAMAAAAELKIDSCPMEGFSGPDFDKVLGVEAGCFSSVLLAVGQRNESVPLNPSFHFPKNQLIRNR